uniref:Uncharacterized protein n=1 Tax=Ditylum brightwellii TaxID=49249 RepID=A0A7S4S971_9STRA
MDIRKTEKAVHDRNNQFSSEGRRAGENGFHRIKDCYAHVSKDDEDNKACRNRRRQVTFNEKRKDNGIQNGHSQGSNDFLQAFLQTTTPATEEESRQDTNNIENVIFTNKSTSPLSSLEKNKQKTAPKQNISLNSLSRKAYSEVGIAPQQLKET